MKLSNFKTFQVRILHNYEMQQNKQTEIVFSFSINNIKFCTLFLVFFKKINIRKMQSSAKTLLKNRQQSLAREIITI